MEEVTKRNFMAIQQALSGMEGRMQEQEIKINQLRSDNAELQVKLQNMNQIVMVLQAMGMGRGPTVR